MHLPPSLDRAVKKGNTEDILRILAPPSHSLQQVFAGRYARHLAMEGHEELIRYLHRTGLPLDDKDDQGAGVLHDAAYKGHLNIVRYLHEQGTDIHTQDNAGMTLLHPDVIGKYPLQLYLVLAFSKFDVYINNSMNANYPPRTLWSLLGLILLLQTACNQGQPVQRAPNKALTHAQKDIDKPATGLDGKNSHKDQAVISPQKVGYTLDIGGETSQTKAEGTIEINGTIYSKSEIAELIRPKAQAFSKAAAAFKECADAWDDYDRTQQEDNALNKAELIKLEEYKKKIEAQIDEKERLIMSNSYDNGLEYDAVFDVYFRLFWGEDDEFYGTYYLARGVFKDFIAEEVPRSTVMRDIIFNAYQAHITALTELETLIKIFREVLIDFLEKKNSE